MALFKIFKGNDINRLNNPNDPNYKIPVDGYAYYNTDNQEFYIDTYYKPTNSDDPRIIKDANDPNYGLLLTRRPINAHYAYSAGYDGASSPQKIDTTYVKNIVISNNELSFITGDDISHSVSGTLGAVTGVKGNAENSYRIGNVNITKANIGLGNVENTKLSTWTGTSNITTIGTLSTGTVPWARLSDIPTSSTTAAGIIQIGSEATNAAAGNHTHTTTITQDNTTSTNQLTLAFGTKYKLTAGGTNYIFTMPSNPNTNTASAVDNILDGSNSGTAITYAPYTTQQTNKLSFDTSNTNPSRTDRLNLNGYLYATKLYSDGKEVLTAHQSLTNYKTKQTEVSTATAETTTATRFVYSITQNDNGEITVKTRPLPTYNNYTLPKATDGALGGIQTGYSSSGKNYAIKVDANGNAYVNVPWENTHQDISGKANLNSPAFTGTPTAPTAANGTNNTQIATTAFVMNAFTANDAMIFKGVLGTESGMIETLPTTHSQGWTYKVGTAGTYAGQVCEVGDTIYCVADGTAANNAHWVILQTNVDGTVIGPATSTADHIATFTGTTGKVIKDSGFTIATSVPANAKFTDTDTKVTSVDNHYTPSANTNSELTASLSGTAGSYSLNTEYTVLTGVKAQRDAKGHVTGLTYTAQKIKDTNTTYTFDGTYNASTNKAATVSTVTNAINNLDVSNITGFGAGKTLSALSETNGKISASFQDISISLSKITDADDIKAIEALTGTSGLLKKTAANTWTLDTTTYTTNVGTVTKVSTGAGLTGGDITSTGIIQANLDSEISLGTIGTTDKLYAVGVDVDGKLAVNVPWTNTNTWNANSKDVAGYVAAPGANQANKVWKTDADGNPAWRDDANTTYSNKTAASEGTAVSLVTTGEKYIWNNKSTVSISRDLTSGTKIGTITINGTNTDLYCETNTNTDTKVEQSASTTDNWRKILLHYKDDSTSTTAVTNSTNQVYAAVGVSVQPSTGTVRAGEYNIMDKVSLVFNSTTNALDFVFA